MKKKWLDPAFAASSKARTSRTLKQTWKKAVQGSSLEEDVRTLR